MKKEARRKEDEIERLKKELIEKDNEIESFKKQIEGLLSK
jgi:predicted RNase H-like nuclease (RuvC/YqgF family)